MSLQRQKVVLYTPDPDSLRNQVEASSIIKQHANEIEVVFQETLSEETVFLDGGMAVSPCTTGFVVFRHSDSHRFISSAGHCSNSITFGSVNIGSVVFENDPTIPLGSFGRDMDFQTHDALAAGFNLRNTIQINSDPSTVGTESVVSYQFKGSTENSWVCKNGKTTNQTCGTVTNISFAPTVNGISWSARYVKVDRPSWATYAIACLGDSGGPVYKYVSGGVSGLGIQSGAASSSGCDSGRNFFYYTPVDEINRTGHSILTYQLPFSGSYVIGTTHTSGKCIGLNGSAGNPPEDPLNNGTDLHQWQCNGNTTQRWNVINNGEGEYTITSAYSGKCVGIDNGQSATNGDQIHQWNCNNNDTQKWIIQLVSGNHYIVRNKYHADKCWDIHGASGNNGAKLEIYYCHYGANQQFTFTP